MLKHIIYSLTLTFTLLFFSQNYVKATDTSPQEEVAPPIYHLIVGSFNSFERASTLATNLKGFGYTAEILSPGQGSKKYRVSIYKNAAQSEVQRFARLAQTRFEERLWIYEVGNSIITRGGTIPTNPQPTNPVVQVPAAASPIHYLIMGSYDNYESAWESQLALSDRGFEAGILQPENAFGHFRVYVFYSQNRKETEDYSTMLKRGGKEGGWIHTTYNGVNVNPGFAERRAPVAVTRGLNTTSLPLTNFEVLPSQPSNSNIPDAFRNKGQDPYITRSAQPLTSPQPTYTPAPVYRAPSINNVAPLTRGGNVLTQPTIANSFYLIANSSSSLADANRFAEEMLLKGFDPAILKVSSPKPLYRVSIYQSTNRNQVANMATKISAALGQNDLWIYHP